MIHVINSNSPLSQPASRLAVLCYVCLHSLMPFHQVHSRDAATWATLCPEITYEILTYCLSGVTLSTNAPGSFPWYLGHICRSWRSVFVSSPRFWDHFSFEFRRLEEKSLIQRAQALVELCIERTKDHPFSFKFRVILLPIIVQLSPLLETLLAHADRWRDACLIANENELKKSLTKAKCRFGQLHSLQINNIGYATRGSRPVSIPSDVFQDAPNLTRVWANHYYQLPWSTLAVLHVDVSRSTHEFFENLHKMTCLEELVIGGSRIHPNAMANTSPIELPSLRILSIDQFPLGLHMKTPALERLYLGRARAALHTTLTLLPGVCNLKTLSFYLHNVPNARVFELTPELDHLILFCEDPISPEAFHSLLQPLASHSTAYSLTRISVCVVVPDFDYLEPSYPDISIMHVLSAVIKSWEKHQFPKLRFVSVYVNDDGSDGTTSAIADLMRVGADKGFEIEINSSPLPTMLPFW